MSLMISVMVETAKSGTMCGQRGQLLQLGNTTCRRYWMLTSPTYRSFVHRRLLTVRINEHLYSPKHWNRQQDRQRTGYRINCRFRASVVDKFGFSSVFYTTSSFIDRRNSEEHERLKRTLACAQKYNTMQRVNYGGRNKIGNKQCMK